MPAEPLADLLVAGGAAGIVSRTAIAPIERVKILYQTSRGAGGWIGIAPRVLREDGVLGFWKGNSAGVIRVVPYLSIQLSSNDLYRVYISALAERASPVPMPVAVRNLLAGVCAGATAVAATYPLDTVRARLAVAAAQPGGGASAGLLQTVREVARTEGAAALYRGCWMSCCGGGLYSGIKFMSYDVVKAQFCSLTGLSTSDRDLAVWQRCASGAAGGFVAQTFAYPVDVMRRRMQTHKGPGPPPYRGIIDGVVKIASQEGILSGLYRGLSLNYIKTVPNVAIYMSLYDVFKYWLHELRAPAP
eukprot:TRINITY_DN24703_c0_g1_i1.p1 TRINITY_DN24703_c0_g1~~TRINITY_DN24703_c0_g1_i1.p1  ORF type:complete len:329 (+),score=110.06 TRINITY_DN24703_c0_g1_i1:80-988(+)